MHQLKEICIRNLSDDALVSLIKSQDIAAFNEIYSRYHARVYRSAYRTLKDEMAAEEATHDAFMVVWRKARSFEGRSKFSSWLFRCAWNAILMRKRREDRYVKVYAPYHQEDRFGDSVDVGVQTFCPRPDPESMLLVQEGLRQVSRIIQELKPIDRAIFIGQLDRASNSDLLAATALRSLPALKSKKHRITLYVNSRLGISMNGRVPQRIPVPGSGPQRKRKGESVTELRRQVADLEIILARLKERVNESAVTA